MSCRHVTTSRTSCRACRVLQTTSRTSFAGSSHLISHASRHNWMTSQTSCRDAESAGRRPGRRLRGLPTYIPTHPDTTGGRRRRRAGTPRSLVDVCDVVLRPLPLNFPRTWTPFEDVLDVPTKFPTPFRRRRRRFQGLLIHFPTPFDTSNGRPGRPEQVSHALSTPSTSFSGSHPFSHGLEHILRTLWTSKM